MMGHVLYSALWHNANDSSDGVYCTIRPLGKVLPQL